MLFAIAKQVLL